MAKRHTARRRPAAGQGPSFDDSAYDNVLHSVTFEYGELALTRASELLAPRLRGALTTGSFVSLVVLVLAALIVGDRGYALLIALFVLSLGVMFASSNVSALRLRYARSTTLDPAAYDGTLHVVVCDDAVHVRDASGAGADYPLAELRTVSHSSEGVLAGFGSRRYAYVPRSAMSEGRFRELTRLLEGALPKR